MQLFFALSFKRERLRFHKPSAKTLGLSVESALGRKCYEAIQGRSSPCPFCTNGVVSEDSFYEWDYDNPYLEHADILKDRTVNWEGRRARLELLHDDMERVTAAMCSAREKGRDTSIGARVITRRGKIKILTMTLA